MTTTQLTKPRHGHDTKLMKRVEERFDQSLEKLLPDEINRNGLTATAKLLGISKATLGYWLLKLGIEVRRVVLLPGDTLTINHPVIDGTTDKRE